MCGKGNAQRIKGTLGITGLPFLSARSDRMNWHLDVGLSHPGTEDGSKGQAVRLRLKWYMSWVQTVVKQVGPYLPWRGKDTIGGYS